MIDGYALNLGRAAQGMVKSVKNAKVACIDFNLQKTKMQMGVQVLVTDPKRAGAHPPGGARHHRRGA